RPPSKKLCGAPRNPFGYNFCGSQPGHDAALYSPDRRICRYFACAPGFFAHQPYWPVQRYFANSAEYAALSGQSEPSRMLVAPVFRGNWATDGEPLAGVRPLLTSERYVE